VYKVADARVVEEHFTELLKDPGGSRVGSDVEVEYAAAVMVDDEEAVEHLEGCRRDGYKVHRRYLRHVVLEERFPPGNLVRVERTLR
jgi:hypothetical protein